MSQLKKLLNIFGVHMISKEWKIKFEDKTIPGLSTFQRYAPS